jgi:phosphoserine aminotransferase
MLNYKGQVKENSILNTANVSGVYVSLLMLRWIKEKGIANIEAENNAKAEMLYEAIDNSALFIPHVKEKAHRSKMNVCFTAKDAATEKQFLQLCTENNIIGVAGHRAVGGFRVSIYNAISLADVAELVRLMKQFETKV